MSAQYNVSRSTRTTYSTAIGQKEPLAHPQNCKNECPYGYGRAFCFPCMAKIMNERNAAKKAGCQDNN